MLTRAPSPKFLWGAASAAHQVEGAWTTDGRGPSKWDLYTNRDRITEAVVGVQQTANVAVNEYDRKQYLADIALMRELGLDAYRFSISWSRILPDGAGTVNRAGVDHYRRFVDDLLAAGIAPMVTLYHWDYPQVLQERGGWHNPRSVRWFRDYAGIVFRALGDRVATYITFNEPFVDLFYMDLVAENVRAGRSDPLTISGAQYGRQAPAMHNLFLAHAEAVRDFRDLGGKGMIGMALPLTPTIAIDPEKPEDIATANLADALINRWPLDAVLKGSYPEAAIAALQGINPDFTVPAKDLDILKANPVDFVGVNFYAPTYVRHDASRALSIGATDTNPDPVPAFNGPVRPDYLYKLLMRIHDEYDNPPIFITENGAGFGDIDEVRDSGIVKDPLRTAYIDRHIAATLRARQDGADVRGYMVWSLLDNFEWIQGYTRRFGLVYVDFATQERTPKQSFHAYRQIIADHSEPARVVRAAR